MKFIQEKKIKLKIGLSKKYNILHFSDVHVITYNQNDDAETIKKTQEHQQAWDKVKIDFAKHFNEPYNDSHLISSASCLDNLINYTNNKNTNAVILTGDIIDYYSKSNYQYLVESLNKLNKPYLFSCGNHEIPVSMYNDISSKYIDLEELILLSVNNPEKRFEESDLNLLKELLLLNKPIILSMHIPLLTNYNKEQMKKYNQYYVIDHNTTDSTTSSFINLIINSKQIKAVLCGHTHGFSKTYIAPNKPQICASSGLIGFINNLIIY